MFRPPLGRRASTSLSIAALTIACLATTASTADAAQAARPRVVHNVRLELAEDAPRVSLVLQNGRIEAVLEADAELPAGALQTDGKGALVVPAFIDAFSQAGLELPDPVIDLDRPPSTASDVRVDMREANRKGVRPALRAADHLALEESVSAGLRKAGFGALHVAPTGELLAGTSTLVATRDAALRDLVIAAEVSAHGTFAARGGGYPSTLMGFHAQLRQAFSDAGYYELRHQRYTAGSPDPRPPVDDDLAALLPILAGERTLVCGADGARDIERWLALADEAGFRPAISGGREAWKLSGVLAERGVPVFLTLDWGEEADDPAEEAAEAAEAEEVVEETTEEPEAAPEEPAAEESAAEEAEDAESNWIYTQPHAVRAEQRREWELGRDCALRLHEAGVPFAFGSGGGSASDLLKHVRELVEAGLPREVALVALTDGAARLLGVEAHLGSLEPGHDASFGLWTGDPLTKEAKLAWLFVDGHPHEFELDEPEREPPAEGLDATGTWDLEMTDADGPQSAVVVLEMDSEGDVTGTLTRDNPLGEGEVEMALEGYLSGKQLQLEGTIELGGMTIEVEVQAELTEDALEGKTLVRGPWGEDDRPTTATRRPEGGDEEVAR